jgi:tryptophanyl-tRNA synthetase
MRRVLTLTLTQLGNYFGALANWVRLQDAAAPDDKLFFSVVGWHALTLPQDPKALLEARTTMIALILASGVDPRRSIVFHQDEVKSRLSSYASCAPAYAYLRFKITQSSHGF